MGLTERQGIYYTQWSLSMEFNKYICGEEFGARIVLSARYNFYIICAVKRLIYAAQYPDQELSLLKQAQTYIGKEIARINFAAGMASDLKGLAQWEAQQ